MAEFGIERNVLLEEFQHLDEGNELFTVSLNLDELEHRGVPSLMARGSGKCWKCLDLLGSLSSARPFPASRPRTCLQIFSIQTPSLSSLARFRIFTCVSSVEPGDDLDIGAGSRAIVLITQTRKLPRGYRPGGRSAEQAEMQCAV